MNHFLLGLLLLFLPFNIPCETSVFKQKTEKITKKVEKFCRFRLTFMQNAILYIVLDTQPERLFFEDIQHKL